MKCGSIKITDRCGQEVLAQCVNYELDVPNISKLEGNCNTIEDTTDDIYKILEEELDIEGIDTSCLSVVGEVGVASVLKAVTATLCDMRGNPATFDSICDISIEGCGLDMTNLTDPCDGTQKPKTLGALLQAIIYKL